MDTIFLNPGELVFSRKPLLVRTILGSCVGVSLFDKELKTGGLCHYLFPTHNRGEKSTKYGDIALSLMLKKFIQNGSSLSNLVAGVIGGAFVVYSEREIFFTGDENVEVAMEFLRSKKIYIKHMNTGGDYGRNVIFHSRTGELEVKLQKEMTLDDLYKKHI